MIKSRVVPILRSLKNFMYAAAIICCLLASGSAIAQDPAQYGTPFTGVPDIRDVNMYEVNTRAFSSTGNFAGVSARLDSIKALGINVIYLMPIYPVGTLMSSNSPYCIRDLDSVGSEFGALSDLQALVAGAHTRNMAVILDFVVNQTSWDAHWITSHPSWYNHNADGSIAQFSTYTDVASLNLNNDSVRNALDSAMRGWVFRANVDGFRCDFADNPPNAFWSYILADLRGITTHNLILMAEGTRDTNYVDGFDYNFGYQCYYNSYKPIYQSGGAVTLIDTSNSDEYYDASGNKQIIRFLTNHDENGSDGTAVGLFGGDTGSIALFTVAALMKGIPFVYNGQEVDFATQITYPFTTVKVNWATNYEAEAQYSRILNYRTSSNAVRRGTLTSYDNAYVAAFTKISGAETVFVISNLQNSTETFTVPSSLTSTTWYNALTGASVAALGSSVSLAPYQYLILTTVNPLVTPTGVSVSPATSSIAVGSTVQLTATVTPTGASQAVTWTTSNAAIATVNSTGLVTPVAAGTATITATTATGSFTAHSVITASVVAVTGVAVSPTSNSLSVNGTVQLTATVSPSNASNKNVTWSSSNTAIASVSSTGLITAVAAGSATVTVTTVSGAKTAIATVTSSTVAVTGVTVSPTTGSLAVGGTQQLTQTVAPSNATNQNVTWSSSNSAIASVSSTGLVAAVAAGSATVTVTTVSGAKTAAAVFTVSTTPTFTVHFYRPSAWGTTINIYWWDALPTGNLANASWPGVNMTSSGSNWYSYTFTNITSDSLIFNDGTNQTGNLYRGSNGWYENNTWYNTQPTVVTGVTVSPSTATVAIGSTQTLTATIAPAGATNTSVTWASNNTAIANISSGGVVTPVAAGTATMTVTTADGGYTATSVISVTTSTVAVTGVAVSPTSNSVSIGSTAQLTATVSPSNATNQNVTWSSSNAAVASVSSTGLVTAIAAGTATVTVTTVSGAKTAMATVISNTVAVTGVSLSPTTSSIATGATVQLTATITPTNATNKNITWSSSSTAIASVSATGMVTGVAAGTATITATTVSGAKTATAVITVTSTSGFTVHFYRPSTWGTTINIYWWDALPTGALANGTWPGVNMTSDGNNWYHYTFTSITSDSVIFNDGTNQTANLYRNANGWYENSIWYNSAPTAVTGVSINTTTATLSVGGTQTLTATIAPAAAVNQNITWSSSSTGVATVGTTGIVGAIAAGTATVTVTTQDGSFTAQCVVTVSGSGTTYYNIINRWQSTTYLYDGGTGKVLYGTSPTGNEAYQWSQLSAGSGYVYLQNRSTGNYMHVEDQDGYVECSAGNTSWYSQMWQLDAAGSGWDYIENRWQTAEWIHIEDLDGYAEYSGAESGWYSAMWEFVNGTEGRSSNPAPTIMTTDADAHIYPNPSYGNTFYILFKNLPADETVMVTVRNAVGQNVMEKEMSASGQIEHNLVPGMYYVSIHSKSLSLTQKLIIE